MKVAQRIECSLMKREVEKLIVALGFGGDAAPLRSRGAVPLRVSQYMLSQCQPSQSDIHDPDRTRAHARDREGKARVFYAAESRQLRRGRRNRTETLRSPQTWDSHRVMDYMGVWCDRLLLGDARYPSRCALLEPHVPDVLQGDAVARVAQSHRHLRSRDVLIVYATEALPFGMTRLQRGELGAERVGASSPQLSLPGTTTLPAALGLFSGPSSEQSQLRIGIGAKYGSRAPLTPEEDALVSRLLAPLCSFVSALWTVNPDKAAEYAESATATSESLTEATSNMRLWRTMQHSMLSTRDTALLQAYFHNEPLDPRLSKNHTRYLAETLLHRLQEKEMH